ncbi:DUF4244 domain-containing protein [Streptomyces solincola]|uniref:DUF4244 domain-containing protein n=1 Tax=Streptomyces solincola TaxID=2100817 RepID=A0A2S9PWY4_9ACTN|nr:MULTISPECIES: DUF4244 domain-containing protein [Streptomyces]PRH78931.1 DUF4244 domain-containing protein [Streptomyces solincola]
METTTMRESRTATARRRPSPHRRLRLFLRQRLRQDQGMTTSEYAMGTIAACGFAAVLYKIVNSDVVSSGLQSVIGRALDASF